MIICYVYREVMIVATVITNVKAKIDVNETTIQSYGEQMLELIKQKGIPRKTVEVNKDGHILVDKDKDPELYDWAVNG